MVSNSNRDEPKHDGDDKYYKYATNIIHLKCTKLLPLPCAFSERETEFILWGAVASRQTKRKLKRKLNIRHEFFTTIYQSDTCISVYLYRHISNARSSLKFVE